MSAKYVNLKDYYNPNIKIILTKELNNDTKKDVLNYLNNYHIITQESLKGLNVHDFSPHRSNILESLIEYLGNNNLNIQLISDKDSYAIYDSKFINSKDANYIMEHLKISNVKFTVSKSIKLITLWSILLMALELIIHILPINYWFRSFLIDWLTISTVILPSLFPNVVKESIIHWKSTVTFIVYFIMMCSPLLIILYCAFEAFTEVF